MNRTFSLLALLTLGLSSLSLPQAATAQTIAAPSLMNFQGRLTKPDGTPVTDGTYSVRFSLWTAATGGTETWNQTQNVTSRNGSFAVLLSEFPANTFAGNLWLEIKIGTNALLSPRQQLVSVAYAMKANSVPDGSIGSAQIANGSITADKFASNLFNPLTWLLGGNSGTNPATNFLGTTDDRPLVFRVNGRRAMRYQYAEDTFGHFRSINVLGGSELNFIADGVIGGTISGGGLDFFSGTDYPNRILDFNWGTIGGGNDNLVMGTGATIAGGGSNTANGESTTVAGGYINTASSDRATIGGGFSNLASGLYATIAGGDTNTASGAFATVPGGSKNTAAGQFTFAAGRRSQANHNGAFVWGDSTDADFASTAANQFLLRAAGGVGINTNNPTSALDVNGTARVTGFVLPTGAGAGKVLTSDASGAATWQTVSPTGTAGGDLTGTYPNPGLATLASSLAKVSGGAMISTGINIGIRTASPNSPLHVRGNASVLSLEGADHAYLSYFPQGVASGRKAYIGFPVSGTTELHIANENPGGVVKVIGNFVNASDARLKRDVAPLVNPLEVVLQLRGVFYGWKNDPDVSHRAVGFLAQEVETVLPELVTTGSDGMKAVSYIGVVPVLVEAVKAQQKQLETLKAQKDALEAKNARLDAKNVELEARLERLEQLLLKNGQR